MRIIDIVRQLLPIGTDASTFSEAPTVEALNSPDRISSSNVSYALCPIWPPDLFAVVGTIIDRSGCYTQASPDRSNLPAHEHYLAEVAGIASLWTDMYQAPAAVAALWTELIIGHGGMTLESLHSDPVAVRVLLKLFAIADETCAGMGWDGGKESSIFTLVALFNLTGAAPDPIRLPYGSRSLCGMVSPDAAVVLPKSITSSVGCTLRSLSHNLALLPPKTVICPSWRMASIRRSGPRLDPALPYDIRLLLVPFPFTIHADSFLLSSPKTPLAGANYVPAYFSLVQRWLDTVIGPLTGARLAAELFVPLIRQARAESGSIPNGVILPECALSSEVAEGLVRALVGSGIEFLITGVLELDPKTQKFNNVARTFVIQPGGAVVDSQKKHHRWRLDKYQVKRYALDFDDDRDNSQWWEDIDVGQRQLPFFGLRRDMSIATLICEDLARTDPAMTAIRAVGPNLVVALLMDGPQLAVRWPGRYATVLAEDPGSAVLTLTCAAMVDRSNWMEAKPARSIGLWRDASGNMQEIGLPAGSLGILLTLQSAKKHQNTLDNRSDGSRSRQLTLTTVVPLFLAKRPVWL